MGVQRGFQLRDNALALFDDDTYEIDPWLLEARSAASSIWVQKGWVTIDDVREFVGDPPKPNMAGAVFRKGWKLISYQPSSRPARHANRVGVWERA